MTGLFAILGALMGVGVAGFSGLLAGGLLGYLLGRVATLSDQIRALREEQQQLAQHLSARQSPDHGSVPNDAAESTINPAPSTDEFFAPNEYPAAGDDTAPRPGAMESLPAESSFPEPALPNPISKPAHAASNADDPRVWQAPEAAPSGWINKATRFLTEGNVVAKIGVIVLFFGLAFLLKYAADRAIFPIELRLAGVGLGGVVLLGLGWFLRQRHLGYALVLQGGGIGVLYLTLFAAFRLYSLLPAGFTLGLMLLLVFAAAVLAIVQDAKSLAILGITGGFLAPILAGSNTGSHVDLFSYYLILNFGIVLIAWRKAWRVLNLMAFVFTFVIGTLWGVLRYRPELFASTEPFLIGFFMIFLATAILFARQLLAQGRHDYVQSTLVFGPPLVGFGLQALLVQHFDYGLAWSAFLLGLLYLLLSTVLRRVQGGRSQILNDAFLALGIGFVTLAVPFAFDGQWTATTWALEGAAMLWVGLRQNKRLPVWLGLLLQLGAGVAFTEDPPALSAHGALMNGFFLSGGLIGLAGMASAYLLRRNRASGLLILWGLAWWFAIGFYDLSEHSNLSQPFTLWLLFAAVSLFLLNLTRLGITDWHFLPRIPALLLAFMLGLGLLILAFNRNPLSDYGALAWLVAFAGLYGLLYAHERRGEPVYAAAQVHGVGLWLMALVLMPVLADAVYRWGFGQSLNFAWFDSGAQGAINSSQMGAWTAMSWGLVPALMLLWLSAAGHWPFAERFGHASTYRGWTAAGLGVFLLGWLLVVNGVWLPEDHLGVGWAMPGMLGYLPVLNGLDLVSLIVLAISFGCFRTQRQYLPSMWLPMGLGWLGLAAFVWLNAVIARTLSAYAGVPLFDWQFLDVALAQTTYSIAWSLLGLSLIVLASRFGQRRLWLVAAGLLGVVVLKLFTVDLSGSDTIARIISFIGVGVLLLLAGYVAPIPAKRGVNPP